MKKIVIIIVVLSTANLFIMSFAQDLQAKVKGLVKLLEKDFAKAGKICPQLCNPYALSIAPTDVCTLCYKTCKSLAAPGRKNIRAQRMISKCGAAGYPVKCCAQVSTKCSQKENQIKRLSQNLGTVTQTVGQLRGQIARERTQIAGREQELRAKINNYEKYLRQQLPAAAISLGLPVQDLLTLARQADRRERAQFEQLQVKYQNLERDQGLLEREQEQLEQKVRMVNLDAIVAQCKNDLMKYIASENDKVGLMQIYSWIFDMGPKIGQGSLTPQNKLQLAQSKDSLGVILKNAPKKSSNPECQKLLNMLQGLLPDGKQKPIYLPLAEIEKNIIALYEAAAADPKRTVKEILALYPLWNTTNLSLLDIILQADKAINQLGIFEPKDWENLRPKAVREANWYDTIRSWRTGSLRASKSPAASSSKISQIFQQSEQEQVKQCAKAFKQFLAPKGKTSSKDIYESFMQLIDRLKPGYIVAQDDKRISNNVIARWDYWRERYLDLNNQLHQDCKKAIREAFFDIPDFATPLALINKLTSFNNTYMKVGKPIDPSVFKKPVLTSEELQLIFKMPQLGAVRLITDLQRFVDAFNHVFSQLQKYVDQGALPRAEFDLLLPSLEPVATPSGVTPEQTFIPEGVPAEGTMIIGPGATTTSSGEANEVK